MLVLSRLREEAVIVGRAGLKIRVSVVDVRGDKVRLGFEAEPGIAIHREEVWDAIEAERAKQSGGSTPEQSGGG